MARRPRISHEVGYRNRNVKVYVAIRRDVTFSGKPGFMACAALRWLKPRHGYSPHVGPGYACRGGSNPRRAMASALAAFARNVRDRKGTFAGFSGYSKLNRAARRRRRASKRY